MIKEQLKASIIPGLVIAAIILLSQFAVSKWHAAPQASFGAAGGLLIENYVPYVGLNGGINTALPIQTSGGIVNSGTLSQTGAITVGSSGTAISAIISTTTASIIGNAPITASTTKAFDIALTGVLTGDTCFAQPASTTQAYIGQQIVGANASITPNFVTILVSNPGATAAASYAIASSTHVTCFRD